MPLFTAKNHDRLIVLIRIFLGLIMFTAGMSKLYFEHQFPGIIGPVWLEERLAEHDLGLYARFVASCQILAGLLLFTQRFATLGAILNFPIILNIFMVTVSMKWRGTPYVNFFFLSLNAWLLAYDYHKLKFILTDKVNALKQTALQRNNHKADRIWGLSIAFILLSVPLSYLNTIAAWVLCGTAILAIIVNQITDRKKRIKNLTETGNKTEMTSS